MFVYYVRHEAKLSIMRSKWLAVDGPSILSCWMVPGTFDCDGNSTL